MSCALGGGLSEREEGSSASEYLRAVKRHQHTLPHIAFLCSGVGLGGAGFGFGGGSFFGRPRLTGGDGAGGASTRRGRLVGTGRGGLAGFMRQRTQMKEKSSALKSMGGRPGMALACTWHWRCCHSSQRSQAMRAWPSSCVRVVERRHGGKSASAFEIRERL